MRHGSHVCAPPCSVSDECDRDARVTDRLPVRLTDMDTAATPARDVRALAVAAVERAFDVCPRTGRLAQHVQPQCAFVLPPSRPISPDMAAASPDIITSPCAAVIPEVPLVPASEELQRLAALDAWLAEALPSDAARVAAVEHLTALVARRRTNLVLCAQCDVAAALVRVLERAQACFALFDAAARMLAVVGAFSAGPEVRRLFVALTDQTWLRAPTPSAESAEDYVAVRQRAVAAALVHMFRACPGDEVADFYWFPGPRAVMEIETVPAFDRRWPSQYFFTAWFMLEPEGDDEEDEGDETQQGQQQQERERQGSAGKMKSPRSSPSTSPSSPSSQGGRLQQLLAYYNEQHSGLDVAVSVHGVRVQLERGTVVHAACAVPQRRWCHLVVAHAQAREVFSRTPRLAVYVDGRLVDAFSVPPPRCNGFVGHRTLGAPPPASADAHRSGIVALRGALALACLGSGTALAPETVALLHSYGPCFVPTTLFLRNLQNGGSGSGGGSSVSESSSVSGGGGGNGTIGFVFSPKTFSPAPTVCVSADYAPGDAPRSVAAAAASTILNTLHSPFRLLAETFDGRSGTAGTSRKGNSSNDSNRNSDSDSNSENTIKKPLRGRLRGGAMVVRVKNALHHFHALVGVAPLLVMLHFRTVLPKATLRAVHAALSLSCSASPTASAAYPPEERLQQSVELLAAVLRNSKKARVDFCALDGAGIAAHLLRLLAGCDAGALGERATRALLDLAFAAARFPETRAHAFAPLLLNFGAWQCLPASQQQHLAGVLLDRVTENPAAVRTMGAIPAIFDGLSLFSLHEEKNVSIKKEEQQKEQPQQEQQERTQEQQHKHDNTIVLRSVLCTTLRALYKEASRTGGPTTEESMLIVRYLQDCAEADAPDVAQLFVAVLGDAPEAVLASLAPQFSARALLPRLLRSPHRATRLAALQLLGIAQHCVRTLGGRRQRQCDIMVVALPELRAALGAHALDWRTYVHLAQAMTLDYAHGRAPRTLAAARPAPDAPVAQPELMGVVLDLCAAAVRALVPSGDDKDNTGNNALPRVLDDLAEALRHSPALCQALVATPLWDWSLTNMLVKAAEIAEMEDVPSKQQQQRPSSGTAAATTQRENNPNTKIHSLVPQLLEICCAVLRSQMLLERGWQRTAQVLLMLRSTYADSAYETSATLLMHLFDLVSVKRPETWPPAHAAELLGNTLPLLHAVAFLVFDAAAEYCTAALTRTSLAAALLQSALRLVDALWALEPCRAALLGPVDTLFGRRQSGLALVLRLSLEQLRLASVPELVLDSVQSLQPAAATTARSENKEMKGEELEGNRSVVQRACARVTGILQWFQQRPSHSKAQQQEIAGATLFVGQWVLDAVDATLQQCTMGARLMAFHDTCATLLFESFRFGRAIVASAVPALSEDDQDGNRVDRDSAAAAKMDVRELFFVQHDASSLVLECVERGVHNGGYSAAVLAAVRSTAAEYAQQFCADKREQRAAEIARLKGAVRAQEEAGSADQRQCSAQRAREAARAESHARQARQVEAFARAAATQARCATWKRVVREACGPRGCWGYRTGRQVFGAFEHDGAGTKTPAELRALELDSLVVDQPLWKVDQSHVVHSTRPCLKIDYRLNSIPRTERTFQRQQDDKHREGEAALRKLLKAKTSVGDTGGGDDGHDDDDTRIGNDATTTTGTTGTGTTTSTTEKRPRTNSVPELLIVVPQCGERYQCMALCNRVRLLDTTPGTLCMTAERLYFFRQGDADGSRGFKCWRLRDVRQVLGRRYVLSSALELFLENGRSYLFEFATEAALAHLLEALRAAVDALGAGARTEIVREPARAFGRERYTEMWVRHELSNFEYLMVLNKYAGRSYANVAQYPVLPWVLADYTSERVDWSDARVFRDLSKPMGAQDAARLRVFLKRYEDMKAEAAQMLGAEGAPEGAGTGAVPPFMYGSHYSPVGAVTFWLMRLEPFSRVARDLQGGGFDCADRLFYSLASAWRNCCTSTTDVKELLPEFFVAGELLVNVNRYWFGKRQDGAPVDDVELPPWARGSPDLLVRFNAEALESPHVSAHLHEWIDLIFGCKQQGPAAEAAHNVFYYLTYPDQVAASASGGGGTDAVARAAVRTQLAYYGQCPAQLFTTPHPAREPLSASSTSTGGGGGTEGATLGDGRAEAAARLRRVAYLRLLSMRGGGVVAAAATGDALLALHESAVCTVARTSGAPRALATDGVREYAGVARGGLLLCAPLATARAHEGYVFGTALWGGAVVTLHAPSSTVVQATPVPYLGCVTALALSHSGTLLAVGGSTGIVGVYEVIRGGSGSSGSNSGSEGHNNHNHHPTVLAPHAAPPKVVLRGQRSAVVALAFDRDGVFCATGAADGGVAVHLLDSGKCLCCIEPPAGTGTSQPVRSVCFTRGADVAVVFGGDDSVRLYSVNGRAVDRVVLARHDLLACVALLDERRTRNDVLAVVDAHGATFVTTRVFAMPPARVVCRWDLPAAHGTAYRITAARPWHLSAAAAALLPGGIENADIADSAEGAAAASSVDTPAFYTRLLLLCTKADEAQHGPQNVICSISAPM